MKVLWTLAKVVLVLAVLIPVSFIVLATTLGIFGALMGLAMLALRIAIVGVMVWGGFQLLKWMLRGGEAPRPQPSEIKQLPSVDPYYAAAMRELEQDIRT